MAKKSTQIEHRVETRVPIRVRVEYEARSDFLDDYTSNISLGGMYMRSPSPLAVGTRFRLRFRLPGRDKPIETYAVVRWVTEEEGMGIQFDALKPSDQKVIQSWLGESIE
jgi:uncharacterized protein (TIGR02266 family)